MIVYEPNKHFFSDITHLAKSWTMVKIMRSVIGIGVYSFAVCLGLSHFGFLQEMDMNLTVFSFLGIVLSILLVFRTNSAYDRWWEGRKQWGALVNNCRNLAILVQSAFPKEDLHSRHLMAKHISNFCIAFKEHLRKGTKVEELIFLNEQDKAEYANKAHIPNHISLQIHELIHEKYRNGELRDMDHLNIKTQTQSLLDILGACERIKKTPIPFSYSVFIRVFILVYGLVLPFAISGDFGLWTVPITMLVFFAFMGIEMMASEIEDPFGLDCNDLPTGTIAHAIKANVFEILESKKGDLKQAELYEKIF